jgi:hypothetical protein
MALGNLPNFSRFVTQGATTFNARTDYDRTITLPNHTSMLTGRPVLDQTGGITGHHYTDNSDPPSGRTLQNNPNNGANGNSNPYIASIFDVVHDNGLSTGMWTGKTKFSLYDTTYNATNGAVDITGADNGKDKLDYYFVNTSDEINSQLMTNDFISKQNSISPVKFAFVHYAETDNKGHDDGWGSTNYNTALKNIDNQLGQIFTLVTTNPTFIGKTTIVLTADHGGSGSDHQTASTALHYTIPFLVWGEGVTPGTDLYALNPTSRVDPLTGRPLYTAAGQPIRNGDAANLELDLLGLGPVPGSTINFAQNLAVPEPASLALLALGGAALVVRRRR